MVLLFPRKYWRQQQQQQQQQQHGRKTKWRREAKLRKFTLLKLLQYIRRLAYQERSCYKCSHSTAKHRYTDTQRRQLGRTLAVIKGHTTKPGRPSKLSAKDNKRRILRPIPKLRDSDGSFTSPRIAVDTCIIGFMEKIT